MRTIGLARRAAASGTGDGERGTGNGLGTSRCAGSRFPVGWPLALATSLASCTAQFNQKVLDPVSTQNAKVNVLFWSMAAVGGLVWIAVTLVALWLSFSRRRTVETAEVIADAEPDARRARRVVTIATGATVIVLLGFLVFDFGVGRALAAHPNRAMTIEVVGHQWWWEVRYDDPDPSRIVVDANELHLPAGVPVQIRLTSQDVIHSFWVPNIIGKRDLIPGYTSTLFLQPTRPGVFRGQCAEFCGHEHAKMALDVVVHSREEFGQWLAQARRPAFTPDDSVKWSGRKVFLSARCALCHGITGEPAYGNVGPDLTHIASRRTLAAGTLPNTVGNLAGWIVDPQSIKPGVLMPSNQLSSKDLQALLVYLGSLK